MTTTIPARRSALETAMLTVFLVKKHDREKDKTTSRYRISAASVRRLSGRRKLNEDFIAAWDNELYELGWSVFLVGDHFALIQSKITYGWIRLGTKDFSPILGLWAIEDEATIAEITASVTPEEPVIDMDEEEDS